MDTMEEQIDGTKCESVTKEDVNGTEVFLKCMFCEDFTVLQSSVDFVTSLKDHLSINHSICKNLDETHDYSFFLLPKKSSAI